MLLSISARLAWHLAAPCDLLLQIEVASSADQNVLESDLKCTDAAHFVRVEALDGVGERIWIHHEGDFAAHYRAKVDIVRQAPDLFAMNISPLHRLPGAAVPYLMDSRYCPASRFGPFVDEQFGALPGGAKVRAMHDWIAEHYRYVPGSSDAATTAIDSFLERRGVCRDFAHTLICFARAAAIPARFASGYGAAVKPQDFHALAELWLVDEQGVGAWIAVDPTGMASADDFARIAVGRDAADTSFLTSYGYAELRAMEIEVTRG
ncbi:transglutaminase family protein [Novosphingobium sp. KCTC 2891]|uniref:transglutaminase-like domain-containing protein n=1 Tax=Novosphingobium sp. KCTC 2891 TaxID=2989730 RepID=UPI00222371EF|nr:transglutaminase family protein [Novosphingobium sp. KCTC 2891]MCW1382978.1 transglutaminase family protein [Novosphingobium sp. KCTC 2891]